jgi:hypothetical protein
MMMGRGEKGRKSGDKTVFFREKCLGAHFSAGLFASVCRPK